MGLIYITGISGAGKSTVGQSLAARGYDTYDVDDGFAAHYNKKTNKKVSRPVRTKEWHDKHDWKISRTMVEELYKKAAKRPVFLCGVAANDNEVWDLFDTVIALTVDEKTLRTRLATRKTNEFGKSDDELRMVMDWYTYAEEEYKKLGATIIDTTEPIDKIVDEIIKITKASKN